MSNLRLRKIISGGQTGADRGGLDAGIRLGLEVGGTAPLNYEAEDIMPEKYRRVLTECAGGYLARTERNVLDADATVVLTVGPATGGSLATISACCERQKPLFEGTIHNPRTLDLRKEDFATWLKRVNPEVLNVAGNRESKAPGTQVAVASFLVEAIQKAMAAP